MQTQVDLRNFQITVHQTQISEYKTQLIDLKTQIGEGKTDLEECGRQKASLDAELKARTSGQPKRTCGNTIGNTPDSELKGPAFIKSLSAAVGGNSKVVVLGPNGAGGTYELGSLGYPYNLAPSWTLRSYGSDQLNVQGECW